MEAPDDKYYPDIPRELDFPGMQFEETPIPLFKKIVQVNSSSDKPITRVALTFTIDSEISLAVINEIRFIDVLEPFNNILLPAVEIHLIPNFISKWNSLMAEMANRENIIISSVFLIVETRDDVENFLLYLTDLEKKLNNVIQLVVVLRQGEFNSVFIFRWELGRNSCRSILENAIRHLWTEDQSMSFRKVLWDQRNNRCFIRAFIQLMFKNADLYKQCKDRRTCYFGRHSTSIVPAHFPPFEVILDARELPDITLLGSERRCLRSLFVKEPIAFSWPEEAFPSLTHLNWTIDDISTIDFKNTALRFPKLQSLTLNLSEKVVAEFSLEPFSFLEEFRVNDCPTASGITLTAGRSFFPLKSLVLSNFKGRIFDVRKKHASICDLERLFIRKLVLKGEISIDVKTIIARAMNIDCSRENRSLIFLEQCQSVCQAYICKKSNLVDNKRKASKNNDDTCCRCCC